jgi:hypothetical protein
MTDIPTDLRGFDFTWSSCSLEHLGTIERGKQFVHDSLNCLKPCGVAVHTTEYNVSSNVNTVDKGVTVLFRRRDIEDIAGRVLRGNHRIELDFALGTGVADDFIDVPPYSYEHFHIKVAMMNYVTTSIGLIIEKDGASAAPRLLQETRSRLARWYSAVAGMRKGA